MGSEQTMLLGLDDQAHVFFCPSCEIERDFIENTRLGSSPNTALCQCVECGFSVHVSLDKDWGLDSGR